LGGLGGKPLKRVFLAFWGFLEALGRDSGGVRRGSDGRPKKGWKGEGRVRRSKKSVKEVEREKKPDLES